MSRYDYYESIERRIEKLERELARKYELFGLFKKKDKGSTGGKVGASKKLTYDQLDDFISDLKKYEPKVYNNTSIGIKELNGSSGKSNVLTIVCDKPATSFNMKFIIFLSVNIPFAHTGCIIYFNDMILKFQSVCVFISNDSLTI